MRDRTHPLELLRQAAARRDQAGRWCSTRPTRSAWASAAAAVRLAAIAAEEGLRVSAPDAAVLAVTVGESAIAVRSQKACAAYGVRVGCFRPPSVPRGQACLRLTGRASLTEADFAAAARALAAVRGGAELQLAAAPRHSPFMLSTI